MRVARPSVGTAAARQRPACRACHPTHSRQGSLANINHPLTVTFLGTGTSQGIPIIGCPCPVCRSDDDRDRRLRSSLLIEEAGRTIVIDAGPDFRQQMLRARVEHLDAILLTHEHNDHVIGLDEVRPFNFRQKKPLPVYGTERVLQEVASRFAYIFDHHPYPGAPKVDLVPIERGRPFEAAGLRFAPFEVLHGNWPVMGFRRRDFTYITDMKTIDQAGMEAIQGTDVLVLNALQQTPHPSHLHLREALELIDRVRPRQAYLTHISHGMGLHAVVSDTLPAGVRLAHDGLQVVL